MKTRPNTFWERLQASYWFIPALMVIAASALALLTTAPDRSLDPDTRAHRAARPHARAVPGAQTAGHDDPARQ